MRRFPRFILLVFVLLLPAGAVARAVTDADLSAATVRKVDVAGGRVTLQHGYLANLDMPPMTMVFRVADPAWLSRLQPGDAIRFGAERIDGAFTVVRLEFAAPAAQPATAAPPARGDGGRTEYRRFRADEPLVDWRQANDEVGRLGGHAGHLPADSGHAGHRH
jgi:Cu/Ag efflux protein CusF